MIVTTTLNEVTGDMADAAIQKLIDFDEAQSAGQEAAEADEI